MKRNQAGSALIIGIMITMIVIIIAIYLFEKIIPFSRNIKGIENGNVSYYRANTALNEALYSMTGANPGFEATNNVLSNGSGASYRITASGTRLPRVGQGNSDYDGNWSILAPGKPIQLVLSNTLPGTSTTSSNIQFYFRVPDLNKNSISDETLSGTTYIPIVNWSLSASGDTLQASGSYVMAGVASSGTFILDGKIGLTLSGSSYSLGDFYASKCVTPSIKCSLKLSIINPLILTTGQSAPYLEYQAVFGAPIPLQTAVIETQGYAGGFRKNITRYMQQMTTNEALDFTVFQ